jgi:hypothetical protein
MSSVKTALVVARGGDRGDLVEAAGVERVGELEALRVPPTFIASLVSSSAVMS